MGDIITDILKRATEAGLNMYLEDGKIKVSSVKGKIDPSLRDEIFEQVSLNKKEIINKESTIFIFIMISISFSLKKIN